MSLDVRKRPSSRRILRSVGPLRRLRVRGTAALVTVLICAGLCAGCSDEPSSVTIVPQCLRFDADAGDASGNVVARMGSESTCNDLMIELVATDIADIWSAEIVIRYPTALARVFGVTVGAFLTDDGTAAGCGAESLTHGVDCVPTDDFGNSTVSIDLSRTNVAAGGVDAGPEGEVLLTLRFIQLTALAGANGPMTYDVGKLVDDGNGGAPQTIDGVTFVGGTMIIRDQ